MKKYIHPRTKDLNPDNWKDKLNLDDLSVDDLLELMKDFKTMENFGKKVAGFLREIVQSRCEGLEEFDGRKTYTTFTPGFREGNLDVEKCTEEMGEEWVENHRKDGSNFTTVKITVKED